MWWWFCSSYPRRLLLLKGRWGTGISSSEKTHSWRGVWWSTSIWTRIDAIFLWGCRTWLFFIIWSWHRLRSRWLNTSHNPWLLGCSIALRAWNWWGRWYGVFVLSGGIISSELSIICFTYEKKVCCMTEVWTLSFIRPCDRTPRALFTENSQLLFLCWCWGTLDWSRGFSLWVGRSWRL